MSAPTQTVDNTQPSNVPFANQIGADSTYHVVYSFAGGTDGADPSSALTSTANGTLYGTTLAGGMHGMGTFFSLTTAGAELVRHSFGAAGDGENPYGVFNDRGILYGTTQNTNATNNCGTLFTVKTGGSEQMVHTFSNAPDGCNPVAPVAANYDNDLYGTTEHGGNAAGDGTVFTRTSEGMYKVLRVFKGGTDGANPEAPLRSLYSSMWGTTASGGTTKNNGTIFEVTPTNEVDVLHRFSGTDGSHPAGEMVVVKDIIYGTTQSGGMDEHGTIYSITHTTAAFKSVYGFKGMPDGDQPVGNLIMVNDNLYGVTAAGGQFGMGSVYESTTSGVETVLHSFSGGMTDGAMPQAGLVEVGGVLYGTTSKGGTNNMGTVFAIMP